jgi:hypothetical protein
MAAHPVRNGPKSTLGTHQERVFIDLPSKSDVGSANAFEGHPGSFDRIDKRETSNCQSIVRLTFSSCRSGEIGIE